MKVEYTDRIWDKKYIGNITDEDKYILWTGKDGKLKWVHCSNFVRYF